MLEIISLTEQKHLLDSFVLMQQLRPHLVNPQLYVEQVVRQQQAGYRLLAIMESSKMLGLAGYRIQENLLYGRFLYLDDLVVAHDSHSSGIGKQLLDAVRAKAVEAHCAHFVLDTGLGNARAQRFYFRNGLLSKAMHFVEVL
ncbi:GNAT family N-acetyltransferase [Xenorhabdus santafensis]|uniref:GNAT family N-acetyltransferase n=1 Tax=Xenorhabdus santafensis TaxID=2582833 RepID=UPI0029E82682|nr:GNAT family N-acetyltransferase [Xenorhabdus sp. 12]